MPHWALISLVLAAVATGPALEGTLTSRPLGSDASCPYGYLEYLPADYENRKQPQAVVIGFHGAGDEGDGNADLGAKLRKNGIGLHISAGYDLDAIVLCPQATTWFEVSKVHDFIAYALRHYRIDPRRVMLIGHSAGGSQVWNYAHAHPEVPAAIVPICGASNPSNPSQPKDPAKLAALPVWAFHCFDDGVVNKQNTSRWMNGIAKATVPGMADVMAGYPSTGAEPAAKDLSATLVGKTWVWAERPAVVRSTPRRAFTLYRSGGHDAWTRTYADPELWEWLLAQRRPGR